jgi:hypothetical protein
MEIAAQLKLLLEGLSGVRDAILCSTDGRPLESIGLATSVAEAALLTASIAGELSRVGELLALSKFERAAARGASGTQVVAHQDDSPAAFTLEPRRPAADLEVRLARTSWSERRTERPSASARAAAPVPASREPVFSGQLDLFCLPDLLEFLRAGQRTGKLRLEGRLGVGVVRMRRGKITAATSPNGGTIGDYLVNQAVVSGEQLRSLLREQRIDPARKSLGRLAIDNTLATAADVRRALVAQVQDAIGELKDWTSGTFAFEPEPVVEPTLSEIELELDPQVVLLTIFKEEDEAHEGARHASAEI